MADKTAFPTESPRAFDLGAAIKKARTDMGISQKELAERAGFAAAQTISDIEHGDREVKAWELVNLARALHTDIDVLLGLEPTPPLAHVLWRRGATPGDREREAQLIERARRHAQLEAWCNVPTPEALPNVAFDPRTAQFEQVTKLAEQMRKLFDLGSIPAASLLQTLEVTYGVKVFYEDLADEEDASAACVRGDFGAAILMDASEAPWRRNFSFAHELFHLVTWDSVCRAWEESPRKRGEPIWYAKLEQMANHFASHFLLPADTVLGRLEARSAGGILRFIDLAQIAHELGVSTHALLVRLKMLGKITQKQYDDLRQNPELVRLDREVRRREWERPPTPFSERYIALALLAYQRGEVGKPMLARYLETSISGLDQYELGSPDASEAALTVA